MVLFFAVKGEGKNLKKIKKKTFSPLGSFFKILVVKYCDRKDDWEVFRG